MRRRNGTNALDVGDSKAENEGPDHTQDEFEVSVNDVCQS